MSTVEITRVEDVREGDMVTLSFYDDVVVTGPARAMNAHLYVSLSPLAPRPGDTGPVMYLDSAAGRATFVRATREAPDLPTAPGSVIVNATIRGVPGRTAVLDPEGNWITLKRADGFWSHDPVHITAWETGRIGYEGGAS